MHTDRSNTATIIHLDYRDCLALDSGQLVNLKNQHLPRLFTLNTKWRIGISVNDGFGGNNLILAQQTN